jgi:hypothetical protein
VIVLKRETDRLVIICMGMSRITGTRETVKLMTADIRLALVDTQIGRETYSTKRYQTEREAQCGRWGELCDLSPKRERLGK